MLVNYNICWFVSNTKRTYIFRFLKNMVPHFLLDFSHIFIFVIDIFNLYVSMLLSLSLSCHLFQVSNHLILIIHLYNVHYEIYNVNIKFIV